MARRRRITVHPQRDDTTYVAIEDAGSLDDLLTPFPSPSPLILEDRRTWHPEGDYRPSESLFRADHHVVEVFPADEPAVRPGRSQRPSTVRQIRPNTRSRPRMRGKPRFKYQHPKGVAVCVRRHQRKEVLFALKRTGKGARARRRRNYQSEVSCSR